MSIYQWVPFSITLAPRRRVPSIAASAAHLPSLVQEKKQTCESATWKVCCNSRLDLLLFPLLLMPAAEQEKKQTCELAERFFTDSETTLPSIADSAGLPKEYSGNKHVSRRHGDTEGLQDTATRKACYIRIEVSFHHHRSCSHWIARPRLGRGSFFDLSCCVDARFLMD